MNNSQRIIVMCLLWQSFIAAADQDTLTLAKMGVNFRTAITKEDAGEAFYWYYTLSFLLDADWERFDRNQRATWRETLNDLEYKIRTICPDHEKRALIQQKKKPEAGQFLLQKLEADRCVVDLSEYLKYRLPVPAKLKATRIAMLKKVLSVEEKKPEQPLPGKPSSGENYIPAADDTLS